jgi:acetyltransferase-like isoleucine patch superfamily enzyme
MFTITLTGNSSDRLMPVNRIHTTAIVDEESLLASETRIGSHARLIGDVRTEANVFIDSNVVVYGPVTLGSGTYLAPNCVLGFPDSSELTKISRSEKPPTRRKTTIIGKNCVIRSGTTIYSDVHIADEVIFGHNVVIREGVTVGKGTKLGTNVVIDGSSRIGSMVSIQTGVYICTYSTVEDRVFLGPRCVFTNDKYVMQKPFKLVGPTVKKGASIGANALLFPGVTIGEGAVVGSQSMVNSDVPDRTIFVGIPAKKLRTVPKEWHSALLGN